MIGLRPILEGTDIPSFEMSGARFPDAIFHRIVEDLQMLSMQYGLLENQRNEGARSRYMSGESSLAPLRALLLTAWEIHC
jgi:hypothetical protein